VLTSVVQGDADTFNTSQTHFCKISKHLIEKTSYFAPEMSGLWNSSVQVQSCIMKTPALIL